MGHTVGWAAAESSRGLRELLLLLLELVREGGGGGDLGLEVLD